MVYKCEGGGTFFRVLDEAGKMVCSVSVMGSKENGYNVLIANPEGKFVGHHFQTLDQAIRNIAQFPFVPEILAAISCGLQDIKNGRTIGSTSPQQIATEQEQAQSTTEQEQAQPTLPIKGMFGGLTYQISDIGNKEKRLDIYGRGEIPDADPNHPCPWDEYNNSITAIWVHEGITKIGKGAFDSLSRVNNENKVFPDGAEIADSQTIGEPQPELE